MYPKAVDVKHLTDYQLAITFEDGILAELDFSPMVQRAGIFEVLKDPLLFGKVRIDPEAQTLVWPNGADICPDVLYHLATGAPLPGDLPSRAATLVRIESAHAHS
jgi:hypothetical protein